MNQFWGYDSFRPLQEEIIDSVIYGKDTLAILPTGGGKSICFQVPGMSLDGLTLVISPLIALMQDQVQSLNNKGIPAAMITSGMSYKEIDITLDNARFSGMKFLYTSPERLKTALFLERFKSMNISLIAVDEAHCISEWGHDFRPSYAEIASIRSIHPDAPIIALTASATTRVQKDIIQLLELKDPTKVIGDLTRPAISYRCVPEENKMNAVLSYCKNRPQDTGIIYCQTRKSVKQVAKTLRAHSIRAGFYHGGLNHSDRSFMLESWMNGELKVMIATNAFGMGIDKPDVRYVLHYEAPNNIEAYYQEAGRAGRDGKHADAIVFWNQGDIDQMNQQLEIKYPSIDQIKSIYSGMCNYLKIAFNSGLEETYSLDIRDFSETFNFSILDIYHSLRILQMNESVSFQEQSFHPTRMKFAIGNSALYKFQVSHDRVSKLIATLTRSYPGIFDRFIRIDEYELAKQLKSSKNQIRKHLEYLQQFGVIDITFQTNLPKITLLHERLPEDRLTFQTANVRKRKEIEHFQVESMTNYLKGNNECRSVLIATYFGTTATPCGNCDICNENAQSTYTFDELYTALPTHLPANLNQLALSLNVKKELVKRVVQALISEEQISFDGENYVLIN